MSEANIKINDKMFPIDLSTLKPDTTLNMFIREHAKLTATKFMCLEGGCGSCVVTIRGKHPVTGKVKTWAANSCLLFLNSCIDREIITCEGIGNRLMGYHPIQKRMAEKNATQCGFCTSGFIMNIYSLLKSKEYKLTMEEIENSFGGNLCRCTGYRPILDAMKSFASDSATDLPIECGGDVEDLPIRWCTKSGKTCSGKCKSSREDIIYDDGTMWYWPQTLEDLFAMLAKINPNKEYMLVAGNTAHGVYRRSVTIKHFIDINGIADLQRYNVTNQILSLGANLTLSEVMDILKDAAVQPGFEYCQQLRQHFDKIANIPVRNNGTLAGNISIKKMHPEFTSDVFITFEALDARVIIAQGASHRMKLSLAEYLRSTMPKTVIIAFELPAISKDKSLFKSYKIMPRAQNAKAIVNAAFLLKLDLSTGIVSQARLCFGGIRNDFVHATAVEKHLVHQCFYSTDVVEKIFYILSYILQPTEVLPQTSSKYRFKLACGLMLKFLLENAPANVVSPKYRSGGLILQRSLSSGVQIFDTQKENYPITQPIQKIEGLIQCSGEAIFTNDIFTPENSLYCCFVGGTVVGATIEQIISTKALTMPGVIAFYTAEDIPGLNSYVVPGVRYEAEEIFSSEVVQFYNQPLGVMVAESHNAAQLAATKVIVIYSSVNEQIGATTLQDVLANKDMTRIRSFKTSTADSIRFSGTADLKGKGIFEMGGQYHFTMEPHTCIAVPIEQGLKIWASTQWIDHTQSAIAKMLNIKIADVQLKVRRLGGAYGAKATGSNRVACAAALAAFKLNRPVRFVQTIESMMNCVGKRWACLSDYDFHVKANGKIVGLRNTFYEDAGCSLNENLIAFFTLPFARNCYVFTADNYKLDGSAILTDAPSSTYCRAPGALEGIAMIENIMEHIAFETNMDPADVRMINIDPGNKMKTLLPQFLTSRQYKARREEINNFNAKNRWIKRGLGLSIMQYAFSYYGSYPATVAIYHTDGSVIISHGGIEMGQGMNTKIAQVAAFYLGIPLEHIKIEASDTINGANSFETASSLSSESVCFAVRKACNILNERLKPIRESLKQNPSTWQEIVQTAWTKGVNLICSEAFQPSDMNSYNVYGMALTEVQVDILTGNLIVECVDILEDCGESLNPYIDVGQVEGAFIMGLGYWITEELVYERETGQLLTDRTWTYTPPGAQDIPVKFRVELLQGSTNTGGFLRSKATGEPPCCLAISVIFAIQDALQSARKDAGLPREWVSLGAPTTPETIVTNAGNDIGQFMLK